MIKNIPYSQIPNQSALFLKYLENSPDALRFFRHAPSFDTLCAGLRDRVLRGEFPRSEIVPILQQQNEGYRCTSKTMDRINELKNPDSVAIVTGQQVGLFTGPLYTIYKALTAIHLSDALRNKGIPAVAVFWMETEDHDLEEVTHQTVLASDNSARVMDYRKVLFTDAPGSARPVGSIRFPDSILTVVRDFVRYLPDSDRKPAIESLLEQTYHPGATFSQSFARLLTEILQDTGLILFDPRDPETKPLISHIFRWALEQSVGIHAALLERNRELESAGFHSQVHIPDNSTVLFYIENGERHALEKRPSGFALKNTDRKISHGELQSRLAQNPEKFSPNVLLRPIIQDSLFPTLAYVGGPAELAYFAQVEALYRLLEKPMPVIWPRESFTLMEPAIQDSMLRLGIEMQDCFEGIQCLKEKALHNTGSGTAGVRLKALMENLKNTFTEIRPDARKLDPSLPRALDTAQSKILHNLRRLKSRVVDIEGNMDSSVLNAAGLLLNHCLPNRNLQERELNILYFLSLRGPAVLDAIRSGIQTSGFFHHMLQLE
ncbi:MAG: bacillithiol biosynthesis cysteine-adding enzyme BshC [Acidobacteria bacterium]|nr:bacillithiol biosynthesis cysteine-adding enzyme BshC [Acidobacteriota bacterium]